MNGVDSIYATENDGIIEIFYNGSLIEKKFEEIREIFLDIEGTGYSFFARHI
jgi:hypothetical protein